MHAPRKLKNAAEISFILRCPRTTHRLITRNPHFFVPLNSVLGIGSQDPMTTLHQAALFGSVERVVAALATQEVDIDQRGPRGIAPLVLAAGAGHSRIVRILLNKGANVAVRNDDGVTALHKSAEQGLLDVTKCLIKAGADLEAETSMVCAAHRF